MSAIIDWLHALRIVRDRCECEGGDCPRSFDVGVITDAGCYMLSKRCGDLQMVVEEVFEVRNWRAADHHLSHARMGFHSSHFNSALVISYDAGGNDGHFTIWNASGGSLKMLSSENYNLGYAYMFLSGLLSEVTHKSNETLCATFKNSRPGKLPRGWVETSHAPKDQHEAMEFASYSGKLMGYAATGKFLPHLNTAVQDFFRQGVWKFSGVPRQMVKYACGSLEDQRALAASIQNVWSDIAFRMIVGFWELKNVKQEFDGIVLTGGCALNVLTNQIVHEWLREAGIPNGVFVPSAPNDGGLTVGGVWDVVPPAVQKQELQYLGFRLWDEATLHLEAAKWGARNLTLLGGVKYLAELLAGHQDCCLDASGGRFKPIVAVVRGRQEVGPRALGHRSLLAVPDSEDIRDRMNRLKFREWYRPVAPMIADDALEAVFGHKVNSPYMSMAPAVLSDVRKRFPAMAHLDGTARHQSVGPEDEPWLHALLLEVGRQTGLAALINTSFNSRGKPIVNTVSEALSMLAELPDLDYVLIEDLLFEKRTVFEKRVLEKR